MLYNKTLSKEPGLWCLKISMSFGYASTYINDPSWHLTLQHTSSVSNNQHMINYPQLIRHEWFDLGKKMTLPDCMNYNYTRPNWVYMYMYYKKIFFVQWEMTQYQWWILLYLHKIILVHNLAFDNLQNLYFSVYAKVSLNTHDIQYYIIVKSTLQVWNS